MPDLLLPRSPLWPERGPVRLHYRERGAGPAVLLLHGGWGERAYPWDGVADALAPRHRVVAYHRAGYGRSDPAPGLPPGFHRRMAEEVLLVLDALGEERAALWGHSDGAVVAAWTALLAPRRVSALVLEALHVWAAKPASLDFFRTALDGPERFGPDLAAALEADHGPRWREVLAAGGRAWLDIIAEGLAGRPDLYDGRLAEIRAPTLLLHGRRDPRTEPGEIEAGARALPAARLEWLDAAHCPHTSAGAGARCRELGARFLAEVLPR